ncbi:uncharacterized protein LY89DRAFT_744355 [Mollisia scopiformis]|uniref:Uncharacterized protein n=1 Tax=Mollisia scopiformis TaxID=149040 RepID=A0A194XVU3_MOLSC|nr:uncharacterized protein LY89DRAFT_744355 [Mollisia scopiformis]KUJ23837.1 hypothetical protein LY89DRAFT_744355 [Mollisia scopiformis]
MYLLSIFAAAILFMASKALAEIEPTASDNLRFFGVWLGASMGADIFRFQSTLIIPAGSPDSNTLGLQAVWPGLQPHSQQYVLQNVLANGVPGEWLLEPYSCCNPIAMLVPPMRVYPGDTLTNTFSLDRFSMQWQINWVVIPGPVGQAAGEVSFNGGLNFDLTQYDNDNATIEAYTSSMFAIELQHGGQWDFGPVSWRDILLEINTTDTTWCKSGPQLQAGSFHWNYSTPVASPVDNVVRCYIAEMNFESPI